MEKKNINLEYFNCKLIFCIFKLHHYIICGWYITFPYDNDNDEINEVNNYSID